MEMSKFILLLPHASENLINDRMNDDKCVGHRLNECF